jgi:hypothetical protein
LLEHVAKPWAGEIVIHKLHFGPLSLAAFRTVANSIIEFRRAMAKGIKQIGEVTQTPTMKLKVLNPFGSTWDTTTATSAFAVR